MNIRRFISFSSLALLLVLGVQNAAAFCNPGTGRWLSKDPAEESGGLNLYTFVANDGVDHLDALGLWRWQDGGRKPDKPRAIMIPAPGDTVQSAATFVKLNAEQSEQWLQKYKSSVAPSDRIIPGCPYSVPNMVYVDYGMLTEWTQGIHSPLNVVWVFHQRAHDFGMQMQKDGFMVQENNIATRDELVNHLKDQNLWGYAFMGHGTTGAISPSGTDVGAVFPDPYTKFGIGAMYLFSCESASPLAARVKGISINMWQTNVSRLGTFSGYVGIINWWNLLNGSAQPAYGPGQGGP